MLKWNVVDEQTRAAKLKEMAGLAARVTSLLQFSKFDAREFIVAVKEFKSRVMLLLCVIVERFKGGRLLR